MPDPVFFKIFLSSPGDVPQERDDAQAVVDEINASGEFAHHFHLKLYRWDDKTVVLPMPVTDVPQRSVDIYMTRPSGCDLVVVLFWSRMGSPLVMDEREYLSGTHYEYSEALQGYRQHGKPTVWLYRCAEEPFVSQKDPKRDEKNQQFDRVEQFFRQFQDAEGRYTGGVNEYPTHDAFKALFKGQLLTYLRHLRDHPRSLEPAPPKRTVDPNLIPYRGLSALDEDDAPVFFGRDAERLEVLSRVESKRLVFVLGASGSGKSSLVAAGVLPELRERGWRIVRCVPGEDPFYSLSRALVSQIPELGVKPTDYLSEARRLADTLSASATNLTEQIALTLPRQRVLLFIDQFEEVFTLAEKNPHLPSGAVQTFLRAVRHPAALVTTLLTMRADFYGVALPHFDELKQDTYGLTRPSLFALYEMITRPAELAGLTLDDGLAEQIVAEVGNESGGLALIAYVMEALYLRARARGDGRLTRHDYEDELNGVRGAINTLADRAYANLPFDETARREALQTVFRELIALTEEDGQLIPTRRRSTLLPRLQEDCDETRLIDAFVKARLLVKDSQTVEVAHEAILRYWNELAAWIERVKGDLALLRQYERDAKTWAERKRQAAQPMHEALVYVYRALENLGYERETLPEPLKSYIEPEQTRLLREIERIETDHKRRRWIGERLATIGDTRSGVGLDANGLPQIDWLPVTPGGDIKIERKRFTVKPFYIARYLVTYAQFQAFLDAPDGFADDRWWQGFPKQYVRQAMSSAVAQYDNYPRDSVSWYQAVAYTRWLDAKYREYGLFEQFEALTPNPSPQGEGLKEIVKPSAREGLKDYREMASQVMVGIARDLRQRQTSAEALLWECLRDRRLNNLKFRRQHPVANTAFVVDFFCHEYNLAVELDGGIHESQQQEDQWRQQALADAGLTVVRFTNDDVFNDLERVLIDIQRATEFPLSLGRGGVRADWQIRLPTEWEWQWAAQNGVEARMYPWGQWDAHPRANTTEAGIGDHSTAVGMYPQGAAGCGALDMAGNLWEWCLNDYGKPDIIGGYNNGESKVLRGGSFYFSQYFAAASYRDRNAPYSWDGYYGLRVVLGAPYASLTSVTLVSDL